MNHKAIKLTFFLPLFFSLCVQAEEGALVQTRAEWMQQVKANLPVLLCQPESYFIKCFNITQSECEAFMRPRVEACVNSALVSLPPAITKEENQYWGRMVGRCSLDMYERHMKSRKHFVPECLPDVQTQRPISPHHLP